MKMPIGEILDRYSIAVLKKERANADNDIELIDLLKEIEDYRQKDSEFINHKIWDETHIFTSSFNWDEGVKAPQLFNAQEVANLNLLSDNYKIFKPINSL
jgi:hypothetical protein